MPFGFDPAALDTFDGTLGLLRGLVLLHMILRYSKRHASLEQPRSAYSWSYPQVPRLLAGGARLIPYDVCPFHWERLTRAEQAEVRTPPGAQRLHFARKRSQLLAVRAPWLDALARTCSGHHAHCSMVGGASTSASSEYDPELCAQWAASTRQAWDLEQPILAEADLAASQADARPCFESLAINDLLTGGEWRQGRVNRLSKSTHINIKDFVPGERDRR